MLLDFKAAPSEAFAGPWDLCVIGTGPAGMTVARAVAQEGGRVLLLEAGAIGPTAESQSIYEGKSVGSVNYSGVQRYRLRQFGGTSMHWAGRCALFDPIDFENRDIFGMPGWPISYQETYRHLSAAKDILDITGQPLQEDEFEEWTDKRFRIAPFAYSPPTRFGTKYKDEIAQSEAITCLYNANATDLEISEDRSRAERVVLAGYDGRRETVAADRFVVALGGMETPRFLLNSRDADGMALGNETDWVGRTFMEHFQCHFGVYAATNEAFWSKFVNTSGRGKGKPLLPSFETMRQKGIANGTLSIHPAAKKKFFGRMAPLRKMRRDVYCSVPRLKANVQASGGDLTCDGEGYFGSLLEHLPNRDSRVLVDKDSLDPFGKPRIMLKYEISDADRHTIRTLGIEVGKAFAEQGIGRVRVFDSVLDGAPDVEAHAHHMGTTRMAATAQYGVVDPNCRLFTKENVYVAGSSVFSTGGGVNPTLTLVSLALRLGEHLSAQVKG